MQRFGCAFLGMSLQGATKLLAAARAFAEYASVAARPTPPEWALQSARPLLLAASFSRRRQIADTGRFPVRASFPAYLRWMPLGCLPLAAARVPDELALEHTFLRAAGPGPKLPTFCSPAPLTVPGPNFSPRSPLSGRPL